MRKYIDCIRVTDMSLAYTIVEALEKNDNYSVDLYEQNGPLARKGENIPEIELRVYHNVKVIPALTTGFSGVENDKKESV